MSLAAHQTIESPSRHSQARLAQRLGITRSACSQWESNSGTAPGRERLLQLAEIVGVSHDWLATGRDGHAVLGDGHSSLGDGQGNQHIELYDEEAELLHLFACLKRRSRVALLALLRTL